MKNSVKEFFFPYDYCESITNTQSSEKGALSLVLKTKKNQIHSLLPYLELKPQNSVVFSNLKYSFFSPSLIVETIEIASRQKVLKDTAVQRHIKKLDHFEEDFNFSYEVLSFDGFFS